MDFEEIKKPDQNQFTVKSNIEDYDNSYSNSSWDEIYSELDWLPGGGLNKAYECIDRHVNNGLGEKIAMLWEGKMEKKKYTHSSN